MNRNSLKSQSGRNMSAFFTLVLAFAISLAMVPAHAQFTLVKISTDSFHNSSSQHKTEVEPDTYSWGSTMVAAFQVARVADGGGADLGFSTSTDSGKTWTFGSLPGWTVNYKHGSASAASDASVVYDAKHGVWLIEGLPISNSGVNVAVSRSQDGIHWSNPIVVDGNEVDDKNWITCDNSSKSKFYGNCYAEWDQAFSTGLIQMSTSRDGGLTWSPGVPTADQAGGSGAEPLVLPNGTVVVPYLGFNMQAFTSTDGGASWGSSFTIANVNTFQGNSSLRSVGLPFPSTGIDKAGKLYVVWSDCSFRSGCSTNDLVIITSANGTKWTKPARIPIDARSSTVDHFIPGLAVDRATSGKTAHLTATYYYYPRLRRYDLPGTRRLYHVHGWRQDLDSWKRPGRGPDADKLVTRLAERTDACRLSVLLVRERQSIRSLHGGQGSFWRLVQRSRLHHKAASGGFDGGASLQFERRETHTQRPFGPAIPHEPGSGKRVSRSTLQRRLEVVRATVREALEDVHIGSKTIVQRQRVTVLLGSANRDEDHFPDPDVLDLRRSSVRVLSFGYGIHTCLGAALARLEAQVAFSELARRFPTLASRSRRPNGHRVSIFGVFGVCRLPDSKLCNVKFNFQWLRFSAEEGR
jgi:Cytochrome P450